MNVAINLFEYLHNHDKAELPGLGTFFVKSLSAQISPLTGAIEPPSRQLSFKAEESGDYSFVRAMADKEFISQETALVWIKQYTDSLREKLDAGQSCKVGQLGVFSKDSLKGYVFAAETQNLLDDSFAFTTLKGVKTFDNSESITPIRTRQEPIESEPIQETPAKEPAPQTPIEQSVQPSEEPVSPIEETIAPTPEPSVQETETELPKETVSHSEAVVAKEFEHLENQSEEKGELSLDSTPESEAELNPIEKEVEVEDLTPASDELHRQAQAIIEEARRQKEEEEAEKAQAKAEKKRKKKAKKRRKRVLLIVLWVLIALVLCCGGFVAAFYFNLLPDKPFLNPIKEKLSYYIKPQAQPVKLAAPAVETPVVQDEEIILDEEDVVEPIEETVEPTPAPNANKAARPTAKAANKSKTETKKSDTQPKQSASPAEDTSPVVVQNYSRLGFDVIGGSFSSRQNAEKLARKAKSLGYDSYVLSKVKSGSPIYYVSYGSRRSLKEANDLMAKMVESLGGDYYVISR